jgi:hypothetical protein
MQATVNVTTNNAGLVRETKSELIAFRANNAAKGKSI